MAGKCKFGRLPAGSIVSAAARARVNCPARPVPGQSGSKMNARKYKSRLRLAAIATLFLVGCQTTASCEKAPRAQARRTDAVQNFDAIPNVDEVN
jgi:hypothetical protein